MLDSLKITFPRISYFVFALIAGTVLLLCFVTNHEFLMEPGIDSFSPLRMICVVVSGALFIWNIYRILFPRLIFYCDRNGVKIPASPELIPWRKVDTIKVGNIFVGLSEPSPRHNSEIWHQAFIISFHDEIELREPKVKRKYGHVVGNSYKFDAELSYLSVEEIAERIGRYWKSSP